jgi:hypothetical protein
MKIAQNYSIQDTAEQLKVLRLTSRIFLHNLRTMGIQHPPRELSWACWNGRRILILVMEGLRDGGFLLSFVWQGRLVTALQCLGRLVQPEVSARQHVQSLLSPGHTQVSALHRIKPSLLRSCRNKGTVFCYYCPGTTAKPNTTLPAVLQAPSLGQASPKGRSLR